MEIRQTLYLLPREQKEILKMNILNEYLNEYIEDFSKANQFAPGKRYFSILYVTFQSIILCVSSVCGLVPTSLNVGEPSAHPRTFSLLCQHAR